MRRNSLISALWKSLYSKDLYQDVRSNWGFGIVLYIFILALIYTIISTLHEHAGLTRFFTYFSETIVQQIPTGKIENGIMTINKPSPYTVYFHENKKLPQAFVVFDMTNKISPSPSAATIVFHSNGYYYQNNTLHNNPQAIYRFQYYPNTINLQFSSEQTQKIIDKLIVFSPFMIFIFFGIFKFIFKLCQPLVYAFIVMIFGGFFKIHFTYGQAYRLAIIAATPAFILIEIPKLYIPIPHPWIMAFIIELIYLFFAAYANRQQGQA